MPTFSAKNSAHRRTSDDPGFFAYSDTEERLPSEGFFADFGSFEDSTGATFDRLTILDADWASKAKPSA